MIMSVMAWVDFFLMKGKGVYIWSAYAVALIVLSAAILLPWLQHRNFLKAIKQKLNRTNR